MLTFVHHGRIYPKTDFTIANFFNVHVFAIENACKEWFHLIKAIQKELIALDPYQACPAILKIAHLLDKTQKAKLNSPLVKMGTSLWSLYGKNAQIPSQIGNALTYIALSKTKEIFFKKIAKFWDQKQEIDPKNILISLNVNPDFFIPMENSPWSDLISITTPRRSKPDTRYSNSLTIYFIRSNNKPYLYFNTTLNQLGRNLFAEKFIYYLKDAVYNLKLKKQP